MSTRRLVVLLALVTGACGGGSSGSPTGPPAPPSPPPGNQVVAVVFYDENGNGVLDSDERGRVPGVLVDIGGRSARSEKATGRALIAGVPSGSYAATVRADSLPPFYVAGPAPTVQVPQPQGAELPVAVTLSIGDNRPDTYMAFGDSITVGDGSSDGTGYRGPLESALRAHFGDGSVLDRGAEGTVSGEGADRIGRGLRALKPAYTLTLYGTNDWNNPRCQGGSACNTLDSLQSIVRAVKDARSLPVLATIIPANPLLNPLERNQWVRQTNDLIRPMARQEGAVLVDLEAAFLKQPDLSQLFSDNVHPNDRGYGIIADEFFKAISGGQGSSGSSLALVFDFGDPGLHGVGHVTRRTAPVARR